MTKVASLLPTVPTPKGRPTHPTLLALQMADCVARELIKITGPRRARSSLAEAVGAVELDDEALDIAASHLVAIDRIPDDRARRAVALASMTRTRDCEPMHTVRTIAEQMRLSPATVHRLIRAGLAQVEVELEAMYQEAA